MGLGLAILYFAIPIFKFYYWVFQSDTIASDFRISREIAYFISVIMGGINMWICYNGLRSLNYRSFLLGIFLLTLQGATYGLAKNIVTSDMLIEGKCQVFNPETKEYEVCDCNVNGALKDATGSLIHPKYKQLIMPLSREMNKIYLDCDSKFFDVNGNGTIWFEELENCGFDFYPNPGVNPKTGKQLTKISNRNVNKIRQCLCPNKSQNYEPDTISNLNQ